MTTPPTQLDEAIITVTASTLALLPKTSVIIYRDGIEFKTSSAGSTLELVEIGNALKKAGYRKYQQYATPEGEAVLKIRFSKTPVEI